MIAIAVLILFAISVMLDFAGLRVRAPQLVEAYTGSRLQRG